MVETVITGDLIASTSLSDSEHEFIEKSFNFIIKDMGY
jgi:hypothetical protein